ncbi:MAG TPA: hypothetical protein VF118_02910 [Gemmatimonadaceae bacterium]
MNRDDHTRTRDIIRSQLKRIGVSSEQQPTLALPVNVSLHEFIARLRATPTGAGIGAVEELVSSFESEAPPPWYIWPDPLEHFTSDERNCAWALINAGPEEWKPSFVTTDLLALLSLLSPELSRRVELFRLEVQRQRRSEGMSPEVIETSEVKWRQRREEMALLVTRMSM